jgi:hypothetical protein
MVESGDTVELLFSDPSRIHDKIIGKVEQVFDALTHDGQEGINLEIDIRFGRGNQNWFRYKPLKDGGTLTILEKGNKHV